MTPSRQALGKTLGIANRRSFVKHAFSQLRYREYLITSRGKILKSELRQLCSKSLFLQTQKEDLCLFSWIRVCKELERKAPTINSLLQSCIRTSSSFDKQAIVGTCVAILVKACRKSACLLQKIVSLVLYAGHAGKQVSVIILHARNQIHFV